MAATSVVGAGTAALAAGRYGSGLVLKPAVAGPPPPPPVEIRAVSADEVVLARSSASLLPGVYGLTGRHVHAVVGEVTARNDDGTTVARRLLRTDVGVLRPGSLVRVTPRVYTGDPRSAFGLDFGEILVPGELGPLPAWFVPGDRRTWVITVHGVGEDRQQTLPVVPVLHRFRLPQLVLGYRNDPGAPASPDGIGHLGDTEWRDLDAAMRHAVARGAQRLVLYGWGTGATMALLALDRSAVRDRVGGLVLDSPVLDWRATLRAVVGSRGLPEALVPLAVRAAEGRTGLHSARHADALSADRLTVPTLIAHGPGDTFATWPASRALAERRPDTVALHTVPDAPHAAMWNADPRTYEETLRRFLTPLM
jgi:alpha-beta hydrolase superfamily lysophospholipase